MSKRPDLNLNEVKLGDKERAKIRYAVAVLGGKEKEIQKAAKADFEMQQNFDEDGNRIAGLGPDENIKPASTFKFRAEFPGDALRFFESLPELDLLYTRIAIDVDYYGCVVTFGLRDASEPEKSLAKMIDLAANRLVDCHVIAETVELEQNYTGERKYGRGRTNDLQKAAPVIAKQ